jgi:hypothetical protein
MRDRPRFSDPYLDAWAEIKWRNGNYQDVEDLLSSMARAVAWTKPGSALPTEPIKGSDDIPYTPSLPPPGAEYYRPTGTGTLMPVAKVTGAGVFPVTEASAAGISANMVYLPSATIISSPPRVGIISMPNTNDAINARSRIGRVVCTLAGGAAANQSLVPALAGYYGVVKMLGVLTNDAAAGATLTFESPAATPALPSVLADTYVANVMNDNLEKLIVTHATLVDNQAIVVDLAGFGAGTATILYEYWYET